MLLVLGRQKVQETTAWQDPQSADSVDDAGASWSNPTNIFSSNDSYANAGAGSNDSDLLRAYNFDFSSIPSGATILGVEVRYERKVGSGLQPDNGTDLQLLDATGSLTGSVKDDPIPLPESDSYASFGGSSDLWGATLTASVVKDSDFGVGIRVDNTISTYSVSVDHVQMRITYEY